MSRLVSLIRFACLGFAILALGGCGRAGAVEAHAPVIRIGYQKASTFALLRHRGTLERRLAEFGFSVDWYEFPAGPPLLEAMNSGSIDVGHTGDSPPIFAQVSGCPLRYFGASPPSPHGSAILVRPDSKITSPDQLRGKRVAFTKGSSAHTLVLAVLERYVLSPGDIQPIYLPPADARIAFEKGSIDAWAIWDPYLASCEKAGRGQILIAGEDIVQGREFYLASEWFLKTNPYMIPFLVREIQETAIWADGNVEVIADFLVLQLGMPREVVLLAQRRRGRYGIGPVTPEIVQEQQRTADRFHAVGLLPRRPTVDEAVWKDVPKNLFDRGD